MYSTVVCTRRTFPMVYSLPNEHIVLFPSVTCYLCHICDLLCIFIFRTVLVKLLALFVVVIYLLQ